MRREGSVLLRIGKMRKILFVMLLFFAGVALGHTLGQYQSKSFEVHRMGHIVDVRIETDNELHVFMDNVEIGTRTNFCTPLN